jgi:hypothetical protein
MVQSRMCTVLIRIRPVRFRVSRISLHGQGVVAKQSWIEGPLTWWGKFPEIISRWRTRADHIAGERAPPDGIARMMAVSRSSSEAV